ncbi:MAG: carboxypeptidase regulatory-like domain-containing protein [Gemmatimonadetes bacterium]|nr:carboxypeptidase regulatory-like domain-containing protein [Gemmatimonadota bacterium]
MIRRSRWLGAAAACLAVWAPEAQSQTHTGVTGVISGVVGDSLRRLDQATIEIFGTKLHRLTGTDGAFRFDNLQPGPYWFRVRRIGYEPITFSATLLADQVPNLDIRLQQSPVELPELEVQGGMTAWRYFNLRRRSRSGLGRFYTRDDIARLRPLDAIDLALRGLPGQTRFDLEQANWDPPAIPGADAGSGSPSWRANYRGRGCPPRVSLNGNRPWPGFSLRYFHLDEIEAMEVYRPRNIPNSFSATPACGLVVVWLK